MPEIVEEKNMMLFNGQIISTKKNSDNEIIKFEQLNINLGNLTTATIKPKIQKLQLLNYLNVLLITQKKSFVMKDIKKKLFQL